MRSFVSISLLFFSFLSSKWIPFCNAMFTSLSRDGSYKRLYSSVLSSSLVEPKRVTRLTDDVSLNLTKSMKLAYSIIVFEKLCYTSFLRTGFLKRVRFKRPPVQVLSTSIGYRRVNQKNPVVSYRTTVAIRLTRSPGRTPFKGTEPETQVRLR
jgi:hypothetical protein